MSMRFTATLALLALGTLANYAADPLPLVPPAVTPTPPTVIPAAAPVPVLLDLLSPTLLTRVKPASQSNASPTVVENAGVRSLQFVCQAHADWPGINLLPDSTAWNLSASAGVEVQVVNASPTQVQVGVRIDQVGGTGNQWNGENATIAAGASATIRVFFGHSWGKPSYEIDVTRISQIQIYAVKPGIDCVLRVNACTVFGKPGDNPGDQLPKAINTKHVPTDGAVVSFAKGIDVARFQLTGTLVTSAESGGKSRAVITALAAAARAEALFRPAKSLDLRDFRQVTFAVRNPGTLAIRVACRVDGIQTDNRAVSEADIAPGQSGDVVVPFASAQVWQGITPGAQVAIKTNAPFLGAPKSNQVRG